MKTFVLLFGEATQPADPSRHVVGEFDSIPEAQYAAESLHRHDKGNWALVCLNNAIRVVRAGIQRGAEGHYWWEWQERDPAA